MKRFFLMIFYILVFQLALLACSNTPNTAPLEIDPDNLNQQVLLRVPVFSNTLRTEDPIFLDLISYSEADVVFPNNYNVKIFKKSDKGWIEIGAIPTKRFPEGDIVLSPTTKTVESLAVFPDLIEYSQKYELRIYVIGNMETDKGFRKVAAYVDVTLQP